MFLQNKIYSNQNLTKEKWMYFLNLAVENFNSNNYDGTYLIKLINSEIVLIKQNPLKKRLARFSVTIYLNSITDNFLSVNVNIQLEKLEKIMFITSAILQFSLFFYLYITNNHNFIFYNIRYIFFISPIFIYLVLYQQFSTRQFEIKQIFICISSLVAEFNDHPLDNHPNKR